MPVIATIHPFCLPVYLILEPIPAVIGQEAGYTLNRSSVYHRATLLGPI